jgi:enamine deaminase RidA (YjgF/YER057c/UK114 family)
MKTRLLELLTLLTGLLVLTTSTAFAQDTEKMMGLPMYDESTYTEFVEGKMQELDALYLKFCATCGVEASDAAVAKKQFLTSVRDLMQHMNAKFDSLDPKMGAALSPTETLVSIHALTMLVDILAATELEQMAAHPYIR